MTHKLISSFAIISVALLTLSACGNTIRGMGQDTANTVDATQDAGNSISGSGDSISGSGQY